MRHFVFHPGETLDTPSLDRPAPVMLRPAQALAVVRTLLIVGILAFSIMEMASGTYNPFIYFRF
jgi:hypothetical protein